MIKRFFEKIKGWAKQAKAKAVQFLKWVDDHIDNVQDGVIALLFVIALAAFFVGLNDAAVFSLLLGVFFTVIKK